jgi:hypothetical protein
MTTSAAAARPFNTHADLAVIDLDRAHLCPCDAFNRADPSQCVLQRWRQFTSCRRMGAYLVHRSCGGPFPSIDDEEFVTRAVNCGQPAAVDGDAKGSIAFPSFPGPLLRSAPSSCAASRSTALPHRSLSPVRPLAVVYPASNGIMGKDHCTFRSSASWIVGVLQQLAHYALNPQLTSELVQTGRQSDVTEKQSQRLECHFGVTGMILFATRYRQPAGGWRAPSIQPNPSELRARFGISQRCEYPLGDRFA